VGRSRGAGDRCLGPYYDDSKAEQPWYLVFIDPGAGPGGKDKREKKRFRTEAAAQAEKEGYEAEQQAAREMTVEQAIELFVDKYLRPIKRNRPASIYAKVYRLRLFLEAVLKLPVAALTEQLCQDLRKGKWRTVPGQAKSVVVLHGLATRELKGTKKEATHTSQLNTLSAVRHLTGWLVKERILTDDPMAWYDPKEEASPEHGSKGQSKLSFSQAEKVLLLSLEIAQRESGKTELGTQAAAVFLVLMTGLRANTVVNLPVSSVDIRKGAAHGDHWILTAPRAKKRGGVKMRPYALTEPFEAVLGPLCIGRPGDEPMFVTAPRLSAAMKAELATKYAALDRSRTPQAIAARRAWLREHGTWRQQINKWQRGEFAEDEGSWRANKRDWVRRAVGKICSLAGVPRETAHALRGVLASKLTAQGYADVAQWLLDHVHGSTTEQSYTSPAAAALRRTSPFMGILEGGKRGPKS
jgi:site-specific recombinase XerD